MITDMPNKLDIFYNNEHIYDIKYANDFNSLMDFFKEYDPQGEKKVCIVSDSKVASHYLELVTEICESHFTKCISYVFKEGEESKNLDTVKNLYIKLIEEKFNRKDFLIALGGGVTGDMCGYTAATYLRGVDFIQIPTSLLADVDSSIGGKTGVDFEKYKNMVGAFHMPKLVYINMSTLNTLEKRQFWSGMGEVVKSALIKDASFFSWLKDNAKALSDGFDEGSSEFHDLISYVIYKCNMVKKNVVEMDPYETKGERALLNFGHTLGHAIEKYMNFTMLHGECVSIGCIMACYISRDKGLISSEDCNDICTYIKDNFNLPELSLTDDAVAEIVSFTHNDKKASGNTIKFILLDAIGNAIIRTDVTDDDMKNAVKEYLNN